MEPYITRLADLRGSELYAVWLASGSGALPKMSAHVPPASKLKRRRWLLHVEHPSDSEIHHSRRRCRMQSSMHMHCILGKRRDASVRNRFEVVAALNGELAVMRIPGLLQQASRSFLDAAFNARCMRMLLHSGWHPFIALMFWIGVPGFLRSGACASGATCMLVMMRGTWYWMHCHAVCAGSVLCLLQSR